METAAAYVSRVAASELEKIVAVVSGERLMASDCTCVLLYGKDTVWVLPEDGPALVAMRPDLIEALHVRGALYIARTATMPRALMAKRTSWREYFTLRSIHSGELPRDTVDAASLPLEQAKTVEAFCAQA